jgi:hypothetical protein
MISADTTLPLNSTLRTLGARRPALFRTLFEARVFRVPHLRKQSDVDGGHPWNPQRQWPVFHSLGSRQPLRRLESHATGRTRPPAEPDFSYGPNTAGLVAGGVESVQEHAGACGKSNTLQVKPVGGGAGSAEANEPGIPPGGSVSGPARNRRPDSPAASSCRRRVRGHHDWGQRSKPVPVDRSNCGSRRCRGVVCGCAKTAAGLPGAPVRSGFVERSFSSSSS